MDAGCTAALVSDVSHEPVGVWQRRGNFGWGVSRCLGLPAPCVSGSVSRVPLARDYDHGYSCGDGSAAEQGPPLLRCTPMRPGRQRGVKRAGLARARKRSPVAKSSRRDDGAAGRHRGGAPKRPLDAGRFAGPTNHHRHDHDARADDQRGGRGGGREPQVARAEPGSRPAQATFSPAETSGAPRICAAHCWTARAVARTWSVLPDDQPDT